MGMPETKEISSRNGIFILLVIILSVTVRDGIVTDGRNLWISSIFALIMMLPVIILFSRIGHLCGNDDIFTFIEKTFGRVFSKIIIGLFSLYALYLSALVISSYTQFVRIVEIDNTSKLIIVIALTFVAAFLAKGGIHTLGRWSMIIGILVIFNTVVTLIISIPVMDFSNILPIYIDRIGDVLSQGVVYGFTIYGETIIFLVAVTSVKMGKSRSKTFISGTLIAALIVTLTVLKNIFVLGPLLMEESYYPSYTAARIIKMESFFERIESLISLNFILMGITKIALCIMAASKGFVRMTSSDKPEKYTWIIALFAGALGFIQFSGVPELMKFTKSYWICAIPFQIILPLIIWIAGEIKHKNSGEKPKAQPQPHL